MEERHRRQLVHVWRHHYGLRLLLGPLNLLAARQRDQNDLERHGGRDRRLDVVIYRGGETFDLLRDAEGRAEASWSRTEPSGMGDPENWRAPVDPSVLDGTPDSHPEGGAPPAVDIVAELTAIRNAIDALIARLA